MQESGYIRIHRSLLDWEWFTSGSVLRVWMYLLIKANWKDGRFRGEKIPRGSLITSYTRIAEGTGLSRPSVVRAIAKLKETGEIKVRNKHRYSHIFITRYEEYQDDRLNKFTDDDNDHDNDQQPHRLNKFTDDDTQYKKGNIYLKEGKKGRKNFPPTLDEVRDYVKENNYSVDPDRFFTYYKSSDWKDKNGRSFDWKAKIDLWEIDDRKKKDGQNRSRVSIKVPDYIEAQERGEFDRDLSKWLGKETS